MTDYSSWVPARIRNNPVVSWLISIVIVAGLSAATTWKVLDATTMKGTSERIERLNADIKQLRQERSNLQARYDSEQSGREETISRRAGELSAGYRDSMKSLEARNEQLLQENAKLQGTISALSSGERRQAADQKGARLRELDASLNQVTGQITQTQNQLYQISARAGYDRAACGRQRENTFSNVCEQASKGESQAGALREKIGQLERQRENLSSQVIAVEGKE